MSAKQLVLRRYRGSLLNHSGQPILHSVPSFPPRPFVVLQTPLQWPYPYRCRQAGNADSPCTIGFEDPADHLGLFWINTPDHMAARSLAIFVSLAHEDFNVVIPENFTPGDVPCPCFSQHRIVRALPRVRVPSQRRNSPTRTSLCRGHSPTSGRHLLNKTTPAPRHR